MRWRWLLLLPVAVVLVLVATASRLQIFWAPGELRDETTGAQGEVVEVADVWEDDDGDEHVRELDLTLLSVEPAGTVEDFSGEQVEVVPLPGTAVWAVELEVHVARDVPLGGCEVSVVDTEGREAAATGGQVGDVLLPSTACEPEGKPGPLYDGTFVEDAEERPQRYVVTVFAVTADDAEPAAVRVWWEAPDYVEIDVDDAA